MLRALKMFPDVPGLKLGLTSCDHPDNVMNTLGKRGGSTSLYATRHCFVWILLLVAVLSGAILRFSGIKSKSLWGDEVLSLAFATGHSYYSWLKEVVDVHDADYHRGSLSLEPTYFSQRLVSVLRTETQAPFYFFLLNLWLHLFGTSEAALRSLSVLISVFSIPLIYALGCRLFSMKVGLYSAFIFSLAPFQVAFGLYNRPYALLGFFSLLSAYTAVRICQGKGHWKWWLAYVFSSSLGMYTHYLFMWNLLFHCILVLLSQRSNPKLLMRWVLAQVSIGGAFLLWAPIFFEQLHWNRELDSLTWYYWLSGAFPLLDMIKYLGRDLVLLLSVGRIQGFCSLFAVGADCWLDAIFTACSYIIPILILSLCGWQFVKYIRRRTPEEGKSPHAWITCLVWSLCIFGGPLAMDIIQNSHGIISHRYFISASGPVYIAVAMAISSIANRYLQASMFLGFVIFLFIGSLIYIKGFSGTLIYEQGAREVAQHIDRTSADNDLILVLNPGPEPMDLAYYLQSNPDLGRVNVPERWQTSRDIPSQLDKLTNGRKRVWYVDDHGPEIAAHKATRQWLRTHYNEIEIKEFKNLSLFLAASD